MADSIISYVEDIPHWELTGTEIAYPLDMKDGGQVLRVYFHLSPYEPWELKKALKGAGRGYVQKGNEALFLPQKDTSFLPMFDKHFLRMSGSISTDDIESQKAFLEANPKQKVRAIKEGFGGIAIERKEGPAVLQLGVSSEDEVGTLQDLLSEERETEETLRLKHVFKRTSQSDEDKFSAAIQSKVIRSSGEWTADMDYDKLQALYGNTVLRAEGFLFEGNPCTEENKEKWVPVIPLWHKLLAVRELFDEQRVKKTG